MAPRSGFAGTDSCRRLEITGLWQQLLLWQKRASNQLNRLLQPAKSSGEEQWSEEKQSPFQPLPQQTTVESKESFYCIWRGGMRERKNNEMAFFTAKGLMVSFLSPLPIKGDKNTQKENSTDFHSCKKRLRSWSFFLELSFQKESWFPFLWLLIAAFFWL